MWDKLNNKDDNRSNDSENDNSNHMDNFSNMEDSNVDELSLAYLPNELKYIQKY